MKRRDAILSLISNLCDRRDFGRTSLQKAAYFLDVLSPRDLGHSAYFYGPYSPTVEAEVSALVTAGFVKESEQRLGFIGAKGFEGRKFSYSITDVGQDRLKKLREAYPQEFRSIEEFSTRLIDAAGGLNQRLLSAAAKVHYIESREQQELDLEQVTQVARQFGWDLPQSQVDRVRELVRRLTEDSHDVP